MKDLSPTARELLELGCGAGEPDDASLARSRAAIMLRIGQTTAAIVTASAIATTATTAKAALPTLAAPSIVAVPVVSAAPAAIAPLAIAPFVSAPAVASVVVPFALKVAAVVLAVGVSAGVIVQSTHAPSRAPTVVARAHDVVTPAQRAAEPVSRGAVPAREAPLAPVNEPPAPTAEVAAPLVPVAPLPRALPAVAAEFPRIDRKPALAPAVSAPVVASPRLASDVASLREAQAALVAGNPAAALEAADRVQVDGPLADERDGVRVLAACAMGAVDSRAQAEAFLARRPDVPVALRIRTACASRLREK